MSGTVIGAEAGAACILVIEPDQLFQSIALWTLRKQDRHLRVVGTSSMGAKTLRVAQRLQPNLILVDLSLPQLNGLALVVALRGILPETRIVAMTSL